MSSSNESSPLNEAALEAARAARAREIALYFLRLDILDPIVVRDTSEAAERAKTLEQAGQRDDYNGIDYGTKQE